MDELIRLLGVAIDSLRAIFVVVLLVSAVGAAVAWAERTRRVNAFGGEARFARRVMDPLIAPVEKTGARFGVTHANAPWWWLIALLVGGALAIGLLGFLRSELAAIYYASRNGPRGVIRFLVGTAFSILQVSIIVRVVMTWVGGQYSKLGRIVWLLTEWLMAPIRRVLPTFRGIDFSPIVAWFAIGLVQALVMGAF